MKEYYHMTSAHALQRIAEHGLTPRCGDNCSLIGDTTHGVFFSEGFAGAVALYVDFDIVFHKIKSAERAVHESLAATGINTTDMVRRIAYADTLRGYLGEGVYLRFDGTNIPNRRNFENGYTHDTITPGQLEVCVLRNSADADHRAIATHSRFDIIAYMMACTPPESIVYTGNAYPGAPDPEAATERIRSKVRAYYLNHAAAIRKFATTSWHLDTMPLRDFINTITSGA